MSLPVTSLLHCVCFGFVSTEIIKMKIKLKINIIIKYLNPNLNSEGNAAQYIAFSAVHSHPLTHTHSPTPSHSFHGPSLPLRDELLRSSDAVAHSANEWPALTSCDCFTTFQFLRVKIKFQNAYIIYFNHLLCDSPLSFDIHDLLKE